MKRMLSIIFSGLLLAGFTVAEAGPLPALALLKTASPSSIVAAGTTITYSCEVVNVGNTTLTDISVTETSFSGSGTRPVITCPATTLAPAQGVTCTGTYVATQADIRAGGVKNTAVARGTSWGATITSKPSTAIVKSPF